MLITQLHWRITFHVIAQACIVAYISWVIKLVSLISYWHLLNHFFATENTEGTEMFFRRFLLTEAQRYWELFFDAMNLCEYGSFLFLVRWKMWTIYYAIISISVPSLPSVDKNKERKRERKTKTIMQLDLGLWTFGHWTKKKLSTNNWCITVSFGILQKYLKSSLKIATKLLHFYDYDLNFIYLKWFWKFNVYYFYV